MHLKRIKSPRFWKVGRKDKYWTVAPKPGAHSSRQAFPFLVLVRDILKLAENSREAKAIINSGKVLIDGRPVKDYRFMIGLMDTVSFEQTKKHYRVVPVKNGLTIVEIPHKEITIKLVKVKGKQMVSKNKTQLTGHDGRNFLSDKASPGDTIVVKMPEQTIKEVLPLAEGSFVLVTNGTHAGRMGTVVSIDKTIRIKGNKEIFESIKEYVMVIGKTKPAVKLY
ncbi:MAG: 30S ribosomal protein S4e, partial [Candidatus Altiarchaeota archaeon]|nr:30S ribosomal protein S4e [Candidatus Altiarchaeota archaeon]